MTASQMLAHMTSRELTMWEAFLKERARRQEEAKTQRQFDRKYD